jgi:hypothetical protein
MAGLLAATAATRCGYLAANRDVTRSQLSSVQPISWINTIVDAPLPDIS